MKNQILTLAVLASIAVGGAFASKAADNKSSLSKTLTNRTVYKNPDCSPLSCSDIPSSSLCTGTPAIPVYFDEDCTQVETTYKYAPQP